MDITGASFSYHLSQILHDLSTCSFVSLDLEFSGIPSRLSSGSNAKQRQTLQERYMETREAAEIYQILQIGFTTIHENRREGSYLLKPYNLFLNPVIDPKLDIERVWSYQSAAVDFLLNNKFQMQGPFMDGVPYISREEARQAIAKVSERKQRQEEPILSKIPVADKESLEFVAATRQEIQSWLSSTDELSSEFLNIPNNAESPSKRKHRSLTVLNRFQKRLVHQLVESEFPFLVTIGKSTFVQIKHYNEERETAIHEEKVRRTEERVLRQTGFRWVVEALVGGDLEGLDNRVFFNILTDPVRNPEKLKLDDFAQNVKSNLKSKRPALVGHNLFMDIIYLYHCFIGSLPDNIDDFRDLMGEHFPVLVDTKYMATHECGSINPTSSLAEIHEDLRMRKAPTITVDRDHGKYNEKSMLHEAGYDSLLTAEVFIKLSAQLYGQTQHVPATHIVNDTTKVDRLAILEGTSSVKDSKGDKVVAVKEHSKTEIAGSRRRPDPKNRSRFAHQTRFDLLTEQLDSVGIQDSTLQTTPLPDKIELIPNFQSSFWNTYSNKLRVFGTEERIFLLEKQAEL